MPFYKGEEARQLHVIPPPVEEVSPNELTERKAISVCFRGYQGEATAPLSGV